MYNHNKPDLLVHPLYEKAIAPYNLHQQFNVLSVNDLTIDQSFEPLYIEDDYIIRLRHVILQPFYHIKNVSRLSGIKPEYTTYAIRQPTKIYNIAQSGPRYVIWPKKTPLLVCATYIDRIDDFDLYGAVLRAKDWGQSPLNDNKSIIVFDLDQTLIDDNGNKLQGADNVLQYARVKYDYMVLYSHGSHLHVDEHMYQFENWHAEHSVNRHDYSKLFDLVVSHNSGVNTRTAKNLLQLYNNFPNTRFITSTLVDDSLYNWTPEYTKFIIPSIRTTSIQNLINAL